MLFSTVLIVVREVLGAKGEERFPDLEKTAWKGGQPNPELGMESSASNIGAIRGGGLWALGWVDFLYGNSTCRVM